MLDLLLATYQSIPYEIHNLQHFLTRPWNKVMLVLDEAHKVKNADGGLWAESVLELSRLGSARVVLTGTPAPNGYEDLFEILFQVHLAGSRCHKVPSPAP